MKLGKRTLVLISVTWLALLLTTYLGTRLFLIRGILALETTLTETDLNRVDRGFKESLDNLSSFTWDWGHWDDAYAYVQGKQPGFAAANISLSPMTNSQLNVLSYYNIDGKLLIGMGADLLNQKLISIPNEITHYVIANYKNPSVMNATDKIGGYLHTLNGIYMVSFSPVRDLNSTKPPEGIMFTARLITPELLKKIADSIELDIKVLPLLMIKDDVSALKSFSSIQKKKSGHLINIIDDNNLKAYTIIRDTSNNPIGLIQVSKARYVYSLGEKAMQYYIITFITTGMIFMVALSLLVRRYLIRRLERLDKDVMSCTENTKIDQRVVIEGNDEITSVSTRINNMLDIIQNSHNQLEASVEDRTKELQHTNQKLLSEIDERRRVEHELLLNKEHLARLAHYDELTALPNRVLFNELINQELNQAKQSNHEFSLLYLDLDRFKPINDNYNHSVGDLVLKEISQRLQTVIGAQGILARIGGDEFLVLLKAIHSDDAIKIIADKLIHACSLPIQVNQEKFFLSASVGIAIFPEDGESLEDLLKNSDMAMYFAKRSGGNSYQYFKQYKNSIAMTSNTVQLEADLHQAIENNEFVLHFQPKIHLANNKINSFEALIRWQHPTLGLLAPDKFIGAAEDSGLIVQIGEWVIQEACRAAKRWQIKGYEPVTIAVNVSPKQFHKQDVIGIVKAALAATELDSKYLDLEITESAVINDVENAIIKLNDIRAMGVGLTIDDFGIGSTSISYLKRFPINVLKIDKCFIKGLPENEHDATITKSLIILAHDLGLKVVAEGVETSDQLEFLAAHKCDVIQGYFISPPISEYKISAFLRDIIRRDDEVLA